MTGSIVSTKFLNPGDEAAFTFEGLGDIQTLSVQRVVAAQGGDTVKRSADDAFKAVFYDHCGVDGIAGRQSFCHQGIAIVIGGGDGDDVG